MYPFVKKKEEGMYPMYELCEPTTSLPTHSYNRHL